MQVRGGNYFGAAGEKIISTVYKHIFILLISQAYIDRNIKAKENAKITTKLIRNEDMTKQEALKAKKQLKENSLPPAMSTRSKDRVLRK